MKFSYAIALAFLVLATPVRAADPVQWNADALRSAIRVRLAELGRPVAPEAEIGPLDERLHVAACVSGLSVEPRSAYSSSILVRCPDDNGWTFTLRVEGVGGSPAAPTPASTPAPILVSAISKVAAKGPARTWNIVVPRVALPAGTILTAAMLEEHITTQPPGGGLVRSVEEAVGLRATASLTQGVALATRALAKAPAVMKGETVTLMADGDGFSVSMPGKAEEDGYEGDLLAVRNLRSGVVISGRLAPGGVVVIR